MPTPSHAPYFNAAEPHGLYRYFEELNYLFTNAGVTSDNEKKRHAHRYTDLTTSELWQALPDYSPDSKSSYADFVTAVCALYPEADPRNRWTLAYLEEIVKHQSTIPITSLAQLGAYYRKFYPVAAFLAKKHISENARSRAFFSGFQPDFAYRVARCLRIKYPRHDLDHPYILEEVYSSALSVARDLEGSPSSSTSFPPISLAALQPGRV